MNLQVVINEVADVADDLLGDAKTMIEARAALRTFLSENHPKMTKPDLEQAIAGVLAILDEEGFFESAGGSRWKDGIADEDLLT